MGGGVGGKCYIPRTPRSTRPCLYLPYRDPSPDALEKQTVSKC